MKNSQLLAFSLLLALAAPALAQPPGNFSFTAEFAVASFADFKDGVGVQDPQDPNNPCTYKQLGMRAIQPASGSWWLDQNMATNLNGPAVGITDQGLGKPGGIDLGFTCPIPGSGPGNLFLNFGGMNWYSARHDSFTQILLCTQKTLPSSSPGCLPIPDGNLRLVAAACGDGVIGTPDFMAPQPFATPPILGSTTFYHDYKDGKGKEFAGAPYDPLAMKNDIIDCATYHAHDYTDYVQDFDRSSAALTFDLIKNESVVHTGEGTTYMAVCWQLGYLNFSTPIFPSYDIARTHDWKLVLDLGDTLANLALAVLQHYGPGQPGDTGNPPQPTVALRGFYSQGTTINGQNGFGPCTGPAPLPEEKKPEPII